MSIEWNDDLNTGVKEIDAQHKELFSRFNLLLTSCNEGKGKEEVLRLLIFLGDYVKTHFATEEALQLSHAYPGYQEHKAQHRSFTSEVDRLTKQVSEEGATLSLVILTNKTMVKWLLEHISRSDMDFAEFLAKE
ncbi:bacteriohemerythrin [Geomonas sp. RF6]|uniref:bacteriohemerythrin n=1 Tax=Geomonas sp. RF6 TaxID=2897342 RepID=UPI001E4A4823|nr:bacteriohemerythrin [Geomonas sp. RF6]UFS69912.1 bacteriohemerythrin [Geomonas sp. RF6]